MDDKKEKIVIRLKNGGNTTHVADEWPDDVEVKYITVETEEEKEYLQWLRDKKIYSVPGLRTKLTGMRRYKKWRKKQRLNGENKR